MEVKIGVQNASRELSFEVSDSADDVKKAVNAAIEGGTLISLTDTKGREILVPADKLAFVEIGSATMGAVGFRS